MEIKPPEVQIPGAGAMITRSAQRAYHSLHTCHLPFITGTAAVKRSSFAWHKRAPQLHYGRGRDGMVTISLLPFICFILRQQEEMTARTMGTTCPAQ